MVLKTSDFKLTQLLPPQPVTQQRCQDRPVLPRLRRISFAFNSSHLHGLDHRLEGGEGRDHDDADSWLPTEDCGQCGVKEQTSLDFPPDWWRLKNLR